MLYGYAKPDQQKRSAVPSAGRSFEPCRRGYLRGFAAGLFRAGCAVDNIYSEAVPGKVLQDVIGKLRSGDTLVVPHILHLARSVGALRAIQKHLRAKRAVLRIVTVPTGGDPIQKRMETEIRRYRIDAAKARGAYAKNTGRPPTVDVESVRRLRSEGLGATEIAKRLGIGRASVNRVINP